MRIIVDGDDSLLQVKPNADYTTLLESIEESLAASNRIADQIIFNGEEKEADQLFEELKSHTPSKNDTLELKTIPLADHLSQLLDAISQSMDVMEEAIIDIADKYLRRDNRESLENLSEWSSDMQELLQNLFDIRQVFSLDYSQIEVGGKHLDQVLEDIKNHCTQIVQSMESDDKAHISDLLEFEITACVSQLKQGIPGIKQRVEAILEEAGKNA